MRASMNALMIAYHVTGPGKGLSVGDQYPIIKLEVGAEGDSVRFQKLEY